MRSSATTLAADQHQPITQASLSAKIRNLTDFYQRLISNNQPPSGLEVINTLRYFQQSLLSFLKDIDYKGVDEGIWQHEYGIPGVPSGYTARISLFPSLNYSGLFFAIEQIIDAYPHVTTGQTTLGHVILQTLKYLYLFIERSLLEQLPTMVAYLLPVFEPELHTDIMHFLCDVILPFTLRGSEDPLGTVALNIPAIIMIVFQYSQDPTHHSWLIESLMGLKPDVHKDLLSVIAMGTSEARIPAANLLLYYWPMLSPKIMDRKSIQYKPQAWVPMRCGHKGCAHAEIEDPNKPSTSGGMGGASGSGMAGRKSGSSSLGSLAETGILAVGKAGVGNLVDALNGQCWKKCYDPAVCVEVGDTSPPLLLCRMCSEKVTEEHKVKLEFTCQPIQGIATICQNKGCTSMNKVGVVTCFTEDCIRAHGHMPIRLCQECDNAFHPKPGEIDEEMGVSKGANHTRHTRLPIIWTTEQLTHRHFVESIVKLLKETSYMLESAEGAANRPKWLQQLEGMETVGGKHADERKLLSRYGIWMLAALATPDENAPKESIGRLMGMVFQWFSTTALLPNDAVGPTLEQLKNDFVCDWIRQTMNIHYDVFIECLLPKPPEYCRTWDRIMPEWLECICQEVHEKNYNDLKYNL